MIGIQCFMCQFCGVKLPVISLMNMLDEISRESDLETRIKDWAKENLTVDSLTVDVDTSTTEEMKYFMITELIRERIMHAFPEVQESYADELTENFYNELFS